MVTKANAMKNFPFLVLFIFISIFVHAVNGDYGGWQIAHATFYGGSDASGTMGEFSFAFSISFP